ncbi:MULTISPECIES: hypothetical protein [unclassified Actinopolyspora]|uniref:hypothetical protein n=1 Tax=unclassified Actinopolyspora TaxID=2639451 RepID=UPI0013F6946A|nr:MULTISPECIES: hypothetical protein [unclassified Actinopolyspora]NHD16288.1 hypothetical protein [Actinopolyspora sp. BKK2]NHE75849.1 hypothetical protein [Actinopolyspora sp. BKK1]
MVDLATVALALIALLAIWLFLRGADDGRFSRKKKGPPPGEGEQAAPLRRTDSRESRGPGLYRAMLLLSQRRSEQEGGADERRGTTGRSP